MSKKKQTKFIFVTGGVMSGLGKGITAASLGTILKARGLQVNIQKCDPYLNMDAGTLNPAEHGEVFVTADGAETDLDLGHYERFIDRELSRKSSLMNGRVYAKVIADERAGKYLGKTVQIIPHITGEIERSILDSGKGHDVHIVEIGGTVGDYESLAFIESIRQIKRRVGAENVMYVHLVYVPFLGASKELKTKPAQNSLRDLREAGIQPDMVVARSEQPLGQREINKLCIFSDIDCKGVVPLPDCKSVYEVPLLLEELGVGQFVSRKLGLPRRKPDLKYWQEMVGVIHDNSKPKVKLGIVAKYLNHEDTYTSVTEALKAASWANGVHAELVWIDAEKLEDDENLELLSTLDGMIVPGGFGARGVEGKIKAANYAYENKIPYLGLCLGMQIAVIAFARQVLKTNEVNSSEMDENVKHPVIDLMADQADVADMGGTMRLGDYPCVLDPNSLSRKLYGERRVSERHRHRYEFNNKYRERLARAGMVFAGLSPDKKLVEIIELANHPYFVASQFHPEFKSRPNRPHPMFDGLVKAAMGDRKQKKLTSLKTKLGIK